MDKEHAVPYAPRNRGKARVQIDGDRVIKDFDEHPLPIRLYGGWTLAREQRALTRLDGITGIPRFLARRGPYGLIMSRVEGTPIAQFLPMQLPDTAVFVRRLRSLFEEMHQRGVAHGDAHYRNILFQDGFPQLVDFATAYTTRDISSRRGRLFGWYRMLDLERIYKVEIRFLGEGQRPHMFFLYRAVKALRHRKKRKRT